MDFNGCPPHDIERADTSPVGTWCKACDGKIHDDDMEAIQIGDDWFHTSCAIGRGLIGEE
jgi:hypothetical protein